MMDCKKALSECGGDLDAASEYLRKKGLASAGKKAGRVAADGVIAQYIHAGSRLGVLLELNCETDFVARGDKFKELAKDMAMQIAACVQVEYVSVADVDPAAIEEETRIEMGKEDLASKPEAIRGNIVKGRVDKIFKERSLMDQPYIKDSTKTVEEVIKGAISEIGENITIRRFAKFNLGEGIEKKSADLAAETAEQIEAMKAKAAA
jgi:elongation factor Ts